MPDATHYRREIERFCDGDTPFDVLRVRLARDLSDAPDSMADFRRALDEMTRTGKLTPQRNIAVSSVMRKLGRGRQAREETSPDPLIGLELIKPPPSKPRLARSEPPSRPAASAPVSAPKAVRPATSKPAAAQKPVDPTLAVQPQHAPPEAAPPVVKPVPAEATPTPIDIVEAQARRAKEQEVQERKAEEKKAEEKKAEGEKAGAPATPVLPTRPASEPEEDAEDEDETQLLDMTPLLSRRRARAREEVVEEEDPTILRDPMEDMHAPAMVGRSASTPEIRTSSDPQPASAAPAVGDVVKGRFVLEKVIGRGGMGIVYRALDLRKQEANDRTPFVALKVVRDRFRLHPDAQQAFQREARKAQDLAHPNIVNVYDFDRDGDTLFMVMELLEGEPLSRIIKNLDGKGMPQRRVLEIVGGLGKALINAHARGVIHADLKPSNCFVTNAGDVKVLDFGIARAFKGQIRSDGDEEDPTLFDPGSLAALTPAFASCEMLDGRDPDPRDDIFALAVVTYLLLSGRHPFERKSALEARDLGMTPPRLRDLSAEQWQGLARGLALDRKQRTPTVRRFLSDITPGRGRRLALLIGGALLAAIVAIALLPDQFVNRQLAWLDIRAIRQGDTARLDQVIAGFDGMHPALRQYYAEQLGSQLRDSLAGRFRRKLLELEATAAERETLEGAIPLLDAAEADLTHLSRAFPGDRLARDGQRDLARAMADTLAKSLKSEWPLPMPPLEASLERLQGMHPDGFPVLQQTLINVLNQRVAEESRVDNDRAEELYSAGRALFPDSQLFRGGDGG